MADDDLLAGESTEDMLAELARARPDVVALARVAALARRIEPELLRALRLILADPVDPESRPHAGTESALWFSALVESRGPDSITLLPDVSRALQHQLKSDGALLEEARAVIEDLHRDLPAVLRWEEELVYIALTDRLTEIARQRRIRRAAQDALQTISNSPRPGLEERVREMWTRLPAAATTNSYLANVHHLCDVRALRRQGEATGSASGEFETLLIQITETHDAWRLSYREDGGRIAIRVPALDPVTLDVLKSPRSRRAVRTLVIRPDQSVDITFEERPLILRTIDGRVYSLTRDAVDRESVAHGAASATGQRLNEGRVIVLGTAGAGKTSLVARLLHREYDPKSTSTHGLMLWDWHVSREGFGDIPLEIWDFGAQQLQSPVDHWLAGRSTVYLVVVSGRGDATADAETWVNRVSTLAPDAPVIVALARADAGEYDVARDSLRHKFPNIREFVRTSAARDIGVDKLSHAIIEAVTTLPSFGATYPHAWVNISNRLRAMERNYIPLSEYATVCIDEGLAGPDLQLLGYLHELRLVLHFPDDPQLRNIVVLRPHWIVEAIDAIMSFLVRREPRWELHRSDLPLALDRRSHPASFHDSLLRLLVRLDVCLQYPAPDDDTCLVPSLLDPRQPEIRPGFRWSDCLQFRFVYATWLDTLIARFMVRTHAMSGDQPRWRHGVVVESEHNRALVRADPSVRTITISVDGPRNGRGDLLATVRAHFEALHGSTPDLAVKAEVPLPRDPTVGIEYDQLLKSLQAGNYTIHHPLTSEPLDVRTLLGETLPEVARATGTTDADTKTGRPRKGAKVFMSYSHQDKIYFDQLQAFLTPLTRAGSIATWSDREITPGEEWRKTITRELEAADLIILLVSADFLASGYLYGVETTRALERHEFGDAVVLPIILRPSPWRETPLRSLQVLPIDGKPISEHTNRDQAWSDVASQIKAIVEDLDEKGTRKS